MWKLIWVNFESLREFKITAVTDHDHSVFSVLPTSNHVTSFQTLFFVIRRLLEGHTWSSKSTRGNCHCVLFSEASLCHMTSHHTFQKVLNKLDFCCFIVSILLSFCKEYMPMRFGHPWDDRTLQNNSHVSITVHITGYFGQILNM